MAYVDASDVAVGAILIQQCNQTSMLICYFCKQLNTTLMQWSIYECIVYIIIQFLDKWQYCLVNHHAFIYTDF